MAPGKYSHRRLWNNQSRNNQSRNKHIWNNDIPDPEPQLVIPVSAKLLDAREGRDSVPDHNPVPLSVPFYESEF
jgi:hypothetical protein